MVWVRVLAPLRVELDDRELALAVERRSPELREALISSLNFEARLAQGAGGADSPAMMRAVVADVGGRIAAIPFAAALDTRRVRRSATIVAAAIAVFAVWGFVHGASLRLWALRNVLLADVDWPRATALAFADGNAEIRLPQGDAVTIAVRADGEAPDQVFLTMRFASGEESVEAMSRSVDGLYTLTIERVLEDVHITAAGGDALSIELRVKVVERPRVDDLALRIVYPAYMEREPQDVPATQGELRLPAGAVLNIAGKSQKPLTDAFVLLGDDRRSALVVAADGMSFVGEARPEASGQLTIDVVDRDRLGAGSPPKVAVRVGDDQAPRLEHKLRGISSMITTHARLPGTLTVRDDFGLREVAAEWKTVEESPAAEAGAPRVETAFEPIAALFGSALERSSLRYETEASVDLAAVNAELDEAAPGNRVRPGMLVSLRYRATDNFGPGDPHVGLSETMSFRVVTREKMVEELRRRQLEQRRELQQIVQEQRAALAELRENASPQTAGDKRPQVEARLEALARQQQGLARRVGFVGETYQRILWEYENNRLWEQNKIRQAEQVITVPLAEVGGVDLPASGRLVREYRSTGSVEAKDAAVDAYGRILRRLEEVLSQMEQAENLAALLEDLRIVIKIEEAAMQQVEKRVQAAEQDLFGPGKDKK